MESCIFEFAESYPLLRMDLSSNVPSSCLRRGQMKLFRLSLNRPLSFSRPLRYENDFGAAIWHSDGSPEAKGSITAGTTGLPWMISSEICSKG